MFSFVTASRCRTLFLVLLMLLPAAALAQPTIYRTDSGKNDIKRTDLTVTQLLVSALSAPVGLALDVAGGKIYWIDSGTDKIQRANLDGTGVEDLITSGLDRPSGLALDVAGGKIYWTDQDANKIQRANLDGSSVEDLVTIGLGDPYGIALDAAGARCTGPIIITTRSSAPTSTARTLRTSSPRGSPRHKASRST